MTGWNIYADECDMLPIMQQKVHAVDAVGVSGCYVNGQIGNGISYHEPYSRETSHCLWLVWPV